MSNRFGKHPLMMCLVLLMSAGPTHAGLVTITSAGFTSWDLIRSGLRAKAATGLTLSAGTSASTVDPQTYRVTRVQRNAISFTTQAFRDEEVLSATLLISNPVNGYASNRPFETYSLFDAQATRDFGTNVSITNAGFICTGGSFPPPGCLDIFDDLGTGTSYGEVNVSASDDGSLLSIALNASAIAALNAVEDALFAFGGALTGAPGINEVVAPEDQFRSLFSVSGAGPWQQSDVRLLLDLADGGAPSPPGPVPVPEPSSLMLLGAGLLALFRVRRDTTGDLRCRPHAWTTRYNRHHALRNGNHRFRRFHGSDARTRG